jgi:hypothetical protein
VSQVLAAHSPVYDWGSSGLSPIEVTSGVAFRLAMICTSMPAGAANSEIFLTMEPPPFSSCHRLRPLEPTTIWVI